MERRGLEALARALEAANVRYLIVDGMAVVAHGYVRLTVDVDLVLDPAPDSLLRAVEALSGLGYVPRAPFGSRWKAVSHSGSPPSRTCWR